MINKHISKWLNNNIYVSLKDKTVFITGGNSGVGFATSECFLSLGAKIYLLVRDINKGEAAKEELLKEFPNGNIQILGLDLASFSSIRECVKEIKVKKIDIDILVNNAGVFRLPKSQTKDGLELTIGTNAVGTFLFNDLLKEYLISLKHRVDVVFTSSIVSKSAFIDYNDFFMDKNYNKMKVYKRSKLVVNEIYLYFLDEFKDTNVLCHLTHPGATYTPLIVKGYRNFFVRAGARLVLPIVFHKPIKACLSDLYVLNFDKSTMAGPRGLFSLSGYPKETKFKFIEDYNKTIDIIRGEIDAR